MARADAEIKRVLHCGKVDQVDRRDDLRKKARRERRA
jgi:hypothetical protein